MPNFGSAHVLTVHEFKSCIGLLALSAKPASDLLSPHPTLNNKQTFTKVSSIFSKSLKATVIILSSVSIALFTGYKTLPHLFITHNQEVGIGAIFRKEVIDLEASFSKFPQLESDGTKMLACL